MASTSDRTDAILPMTNDYMQHIVRKEKTYEFRRYRIAASVKRAWFYLNAPFSHIAYVSEIDPARTRNAGDEPLDGDGLGNKEFNERHPSWDKYDYAYRVRSVYRLAEPITLAEMKAKYGFKGAPRSLVYTPEPLRKAVDWKEHECIWSLQLLDSEQNAAPAVVGRKREAKEEAEPTSVKRPRMDGE